jgi:hypothetical protein
MVLDVVEANDNMEPYSFDWIAPTYTYIIRASLRHLSERMMTIEDKHNPWMRTTKDRLVLALDEFNRRWNLNTSPEA